MSKASQPAPPEPAPPELGPPPVIDYLVTRGGQYIGLHQITAIPAGSVVSRLTHDLDSLRGQGIEMRQVESYKIIAGPLGTFLSVVA